jgi:hypothetical protein
MEAHPAPTHSRQARSEEDTAQGRIASGPRRVRPVLVGATSSMAPGGPSGSPSKSGTRLGLPPAAAQPLGIELSLRKIPIGNSRVGLLPKRVAWGLTSVRNPEGGTVRLELRSC